MAKYIKGNFIIKIGYILKIISYFSNNSTSQLDKVTNSTLHPVEALRYLLATAGFTDL